MDLQAFGRPADVDVLLFPNLVGSFGECTLFKILQERLLGACLHKFFAVPGLRQAICGYFEARLLSYLCQRPIRFTERRP